MAVFHKHISLSSISSLQNLHSEWSIYTLHFRERLKPYLSLPLAICDVQKSIRFFAHPALSAYSYLSPHERLINTEWKQLFVWSPCLSQRSWIKPGRGRPDQNKQCNPYISDNSSPKWRLVIRFLQTSDRTVKCLHAILDHNAKCLNAEELESPRF